MSFFAQEKKLLIALLAAAFILRLASVEFGLLYHESFPDEIVHVAAAFKMLAQKSLRADFSFYYLPPLMAYLLAPIFAFLGLVGIAAGKFQNLAAYQHFVLLYREYFLSVSRIISAVFGTASIYFLFLLAKKLFDKKIALLASALLAFDFVHLHESQTGHIWAPIAFFTLAAFYFFFRIYQSGEKKWYVWSALMIGLGYGMGQIPIVYYIPFLLVHIFSRPKEESFKKKILNKTFINASLLILFIFILFSYLNTYAFLKHFFYDVAQPLLQDLGFRAVSLPTAAEAPVSFLSLNFKTIAATIFYDNPLILMAAIFGSLIILRKYKSSDLRNIFLIFFPLVYLILFALLFYQFQFLYRYVLPVTPFLIISASYFIFWLCDKTSDKNYQRVFFFIFICLTLGYSLTASFLYTFKLLKGYTISKGIEWIYDNVPSGSRILTNTYFTPTKESLNFLISRRMLINWLDTRKTYLLSLAEDQYPKPNYFLLNPEFTDLGSLTSAERRADYFFVAFYTRQQEEDKKQVLKFYQGEKEIIAKFYPTKEKEEELIELVNYNPHFLLPTLLKIKYLGPYVEIYKLKND